MRFIVDGHKPVLGPVAETDPYRIQMYGPWVVEFTTGEPRLLLKISARPFGHWIGSNNRRTLRLGHYKKPESYYRRRNIPKGLRAVSAC